MPTLKELIQQRSDRLQSVPDNFITAVEKSQIQLYEQALQLLAQLDLTQGSISVNEKNLQAVNEIINVLQRTMTEGDYLDALGIFVRDYEKQTGLINEIIKASFDSFVETALYEQAKQNAIENTILLFDETAINSRLFTPLKSILNDAVSTGMTLEDATFILREFMINDEENLGVFQRYARQVAHDAFAVTDRTYANVIHQDLGVKKFSYFGGTLEDSRCFCVERTEKIWAKEQIESWGKRQDLGNCEISLKSGRKGWRGINDSVNEKTIFNYLGGWNCIHVLIAVPDDK